jgi:hypothetical protein
VALWGYSQGGAAVASAAELASSYAPDIHLVGTYAGAPPADLPALLPSVDRSSVAGLLGYILNGLIYAYPGIEPVVRADLTDWGQTMLDTTRTECVFQTTFEYAFHPIQEFFSVPLDQLDPAVTALLDAQRIGGLRPNAPVFLDIGRNDSLIPYPTVVQLARDWCARGGDVQLWTNDEPPFLNKLGLQHDLTYLVDGERSLDWIADRFNGLPTTPNCGNIYPN